MNFKYLFIQNSRLEVAHQKIDLKTNNMYEELLYELLYVEVISFFLVQELLAQEESLSHHIPVICDVDVVTLGHILFVNCCPF